MGLLDNIKKLEAIDDTVECYCPDGVEEYWNCRSCYAGGILNELSSIAYDGVHELLKDKSDYVR